MEEELRQLKRFRPQIQSVVDAAEKGERPITGPLREWLLQLKDALHEADDVLDELDYFRLKQQAEEDVNKSKDMKYYKSKAMKIAKRILKPYPTLEKLRRATKKLGEVAADAGNFVALVSNAQREFQQQEAQTIRRRETGPSLTENKVFGREKERDELLQWLTTDGSNTNVSLFSVVGHGGMGKTTLAQLVFRDEMVEKSFDLKIWVYVSTSFDVRELTRSILRSILGSARKQRADGNGLAELQDALEKELETSGKFLLILDDVWNDDDISSWNKLLAPLKCGHKGSKILLTTRTDLVADTAARAIGASAKGSLKLGGLHGEDFSSLFNRYAFAGIDCKNHSNLQRIGMKIAERLGSSPLAAKIVGGLLNSYDLDERHWNKILHSKNISDEVKHGEDNITSILMLSYHHLPLHLRPCFAYCGMFPKNHWFDKKDLVLKWMAVGLIQHSHKIQDEMLEDIGVYYFDELSRRSLFGHIFDNCYVMHDLLHDLAQSVSHGDCSSFVDNDNKVEDTIPNTVRHLHIESGNLDLLPKKDNWHNLSSLVLRIKDARPGDFSALEKVLRSLKSVRTLMLYVDVRGDTGVKMPDVFSHLIHLRSLVICSGRLQQFPRSLCKLYHLQVLEFYYEEGTFKLPESMNKLVNLRHLSPSDQVVGVGKLISLQELVFSVRKERGYKIGELGDLIWLRTLCVGGLENVENQEEASTAKLCDKKDLQKLYLGWSISSDPGMDEHELVLDRLQPHANLKELKIEGYRGIRYANWMGFELINNIVHLDLCNCSRLDHLPPLGRLPSLEKFVLTKMPAIKKLDYQCQRLKELYIDDMEGLEKLSGSSGGQWHPHLHTLKIINCPKLKVIPSLSLSIKNVLLENLGLVSLPTLQLDCNSASGSPSSSSALLEDLKIKNCGKITSLGEGLLQLQHYLTALESLNIKDCAELVDFPSGGLQHLRALRTLSIQRCPKLRVAPGPITPSGENDDKFLPSSLKFLYLRRPHAELVRSMPTLLKGVVSLDELRIDDCPKLAHVVESVLEPNCAVTVDLLEIDDPLLLASAVFLRSLTSVRVLEIQRCRRLESIEGELEQWFLQNQTTLEKITIYEASALNFLPGCLKNLSSLRSLEIYKANETLIERCRKDEGADWPIISHIQEVQIRSRGGSQQVP